MSCKYTIKYQWWIQDFPDGTKFIQKLHDNERNWTEWGGGRVPNKPPLDPSMSTRSGSRVGERCRGDKDYPLLYIPVK